MPGAAEGAVRLSYSFPIAFLWLSYGFVGAAWAAGTGRVSGWDRTPVAAGLLSPPVLSSRPLLSGRPVLARRRALPAVSCPLGSSISCRFREQNVPGAKRGKPVIGRTCSECK